MFVLSAITNSILVPVLGVQKSEERFCDLEEGLAISLSTMHIIHAGRTIRPTLLYFLHAPNPTF